MRGKKNSATTSNLTGAVKGEAGAVNTVKKTGKGQRATREKKKSKKEELRPEVIIQYAGNAAQVEEIVEQVKKLYVEDGHYLASLKSLQVYVKPEENAAYYVINKKQNGKIDLF
ncbi:MAG: hypothetical protein J1E98_00400 [Lachnospiraceae bacterium]|nr:hypothetical protein [Lachnospiraceae bacterium]